MTSDPTTLPGADGHHTAADHFRTAEMHAACALGLLRSKSKEQAGQFERHMQLATFHGQAAATLIAAHGLVHEVDVRPERAAWTTYFQDKKRQSDRAVMDRASRVRGLPT